MASEFSIKILTSQRQPPIEQVDLIVRGVKDEEHPATNSSGDPS